MRSVWSFINRHYQAIGVVTSILAVVLTALVAVYEYRAENARKGVERSIMFSHQYRSGRLLKAREELQKLFEEIFLSETSKQLTVEQKNEKLLRSLRGGGDSVNYGILMEFFSSAYKCQELDACDSDALNGLLSYDACHFLVRHYWRIKEQTELEAQYTEGVRYFAGKHNQGKCRI